MRVVIDTNLLISALISPGNLPEQILQLWLAKRFDLVTSEWQLGELRRVSRYDDVKRNFPPHQAGRMINGLRVKAMVLDELPEVNYSPDPDDNNIIAAALAGNAQYVVSGDKRDVLKLKKVEGIPILKAREFIRLFDKSVQ